MLRDLLVSDGKLSVFNDQALVFLLLVGFWILSSAASNLATLTIRPHLMTLLGMSEGVYIDAKAINTGGAPGAKSLNAAVTVTVGSETARLATLRPDDPLRREAEATGLCKYSTVTLSCQRALQRRTRSSVNSRKTGGGAQRGVAPA